MCFSHLLLIPLLDFYRRALDVDGMANRWPDMPSKKNKRKINSYYQISSLATTEKRPHRNAQTKKIDCRVQPRGCFQQNVGCPITDGHTHRPNDPKLSHGCGESTHGSAQPKDKQNENNQS